MAIRCTASDTTTPTVPEFTRMEVVEEAAEVFGAWQTWVDGGWCAGDRGALIGECADTIQAVCNLLDALGVVDMEQHMEECRARNEARGREYR